MSRHMSEPYSRARSPSLLDDDDKDGLVTIAQPHATYLAAPGQCEADLCSWDLFWSCPDALLHVGPEADALLTEACAMALSGGGTPAAVGERAAGAGGRSHVPATNTFGGNTYDSSSSNDGGGSSNDGQTRPTSGVDQQAACQPQAAISQPRSFENSPHEQHTLVQGTKRPAPKVLSGCTKRRHTHADVSQHLRAMRLAVPVLNAVMGQKKTQQYRQLGWQLLGRSGAKPPANYFRFLNVPQFEVLISGLLGVAVTHVEGEGLRAAASPAPALTVPVWGDKDWVLKLFNAMAGREVLRDREELQQLVAKAGPHAQSPYKADFQGLAAAGLHCEHWQGPLHPAQNMLG